MKVKITGKKLFKEDSLRDVAEILPVMEVSLPGVGKVSVYDVSRPSGPDEEESSVRSNDDAYEAILKKWNEEKCRATQIATEIVNDLLEQGNKVLEQLTTDETTTKNKRVEARITECYEDASSVREIKVPNGRTIDELVAYYEAECNRIIKRCNTISTGAALTHYGVYKELSNELNRAEELHPIWSSNIVEQVAVMVGEAGEALRAALHYNEGRDTEGRPSIEALREELIQTGAMVLRCLKNLPGGPNGERKN